MRSAAQPSPALFSSAEPGTPEGTWARVLPRRPSLALPTGPGRVVVVAPHPDDEVLACGGLLRVLHDRGWTVRIVSVTDGEAAYPGTAHLAAIRRSELAGALAALGVETDVVRLGLPDGAVGDHEVELAGLLGRATHGASLVLAPFAGDGHPDHDATGRAAARALRAVGCDGVEPTLLGYPVWAWHWSGPESPWFATTRVLPLTPPVLAAKARAIEMFASQFDGRFGAPVLPPWVLRRFSRRYETFLPGTLPGALRGTLAVADPAGVSVRS